MSEFMKKSTVRRIADDGRFNFEVNVDNCGIEVKGTLSVTASDEWEARELAWLYIIEKRESIIRNN